MINKIKKLLELSDDAQDALIGTLIEISESEIREYCNMPSGADLSELSGTIIQMVLFKYNRIGTEGVNSESYSGASYNYAEDYPESVRSVLRRNRRLKAV